MNQPEAKFKRKLCEFYEEVFPSPEGWHFYFPAAVKYGVPDLYFSVGGRGVWIEAKVENNPLRKIQEVQIGKMRAAGERVLVIRLRNPEEKKDKRYIEIANGDNPDTFSMTSDYLALKTRRMWNLIGGMS